eukprot:TRINITY_DN993_c0_g1_i11.p1 TRINITY_DN993_c0_g1~~TRINITY_DN993_c0_g1_i11.p1  ORF type:complete len:560 (+),score=15.94 TRINITY_DN993_c0_g1_i11:1080-2759(+)
MSVRSGQREVGSSNAVAAARRAKTEALVSTVVLKERLVYHEGDPLCAAMHHTVRKELTSLWQKYPEGYLKARMAGSGSRREDLWTLNERCVVFEGDMPSTGELVVVWVARNETLVGRMGVVAAREDGVYATRLHTDFSESDANENWEVKLLNGEQRNFACWRPSGYEVAFWHEMHDASRTNAGKLGQVHLVQVAPVWCQPRGRFAKAHSLRDYVVVRKVLSGEVLQVAAHRLTPCILPVGAPIRCNIDHKWEWCRMVEDFSGTNTKVEEADVWDPLLRVEMEGSGVVYDVPASCVSNCTIPYWIMPITPSHTPVDVTICSNDAGPLVTDYMLLGRGQMVGINAPPPQLDFQVPVNMVTGRYVSHTLCELVSDHGTVRPRRAVHMQHNGGTSQQRHTTGDDVGQVKPSHSNAKRVDALFEGQKSALLSGDGSSTLARGNVQSVYSAQDQPADVSALLKETVAAAHVTAAAEDKVGDVTVQAGQEFAVGAAIALTSVEQAPELTMPSCMHNRKSATDNIKMQSLLGFDAEELRTGLYKAALPFIFESMPSLRPPAEPPPSS